MPKGTVILFNDISGTGRIQGDDGIIAKVSHKSLTGDGYKILDEGQRVRFEAMRVEAGFEARSVEVLS